MAYVIELMSIGEDLYPLLESSAKRLNGVQREFEFRLTTEAQRSIGLTFKRATYLTTDIWAFLNEQKKTFGGNRPYIIAFINARLKSSELGNIFGSHEAKKYGLAVVTVHDSGQYVKEEKRYCSYYMVRYALSFVNPSIKSHNDPTRASCYFHKKLYKPDIRLSMDTGEICDECAHKLDNPPVDGVSKVLSADERAALSTMRAVVSGDNPFAIIMKGGGVKGLAFASALIELEKHFWFDRHVGTSAGAITAVLLAASYSPSELVAILRAKNFREFMDAKLWKIPFNLILKGGLFPGEHFREWIAGLLGTKTGKVGETLMSDLNGAVIYASRWGPGTLVFDSTGERKDTVAAFATRCSMAIPVFFSPEYIDGRKAYDGGVRNNFPVSKFLNDHPGKPFIALYLGKRDERNRRFMGSELLDIVIDGEERNVVDANRESIVVIDTSPIGTVDFRLQDMEKDFLLKVGRASALQFLRDRKLDDGPDDAVVRNAHEESEASRIAVCQMRKKRRWRRIVGVLLILVMFFIARYWGLLVMLWSALRRIIGVN
jgi:predicted acylesterase/phospholipase RssA